MYKYILILIAALCAYACGGDPSVSSNGNAVHQPLDPGPPAGNGEVAETTEFGFNLFAEVVAENEDKNVFISPPSVAIALAMTYNGATGSTADAMRRTLSLDGLDRDQINAGFADLLTFLTNPDSAVELSIANSLWGREGIQFDEEFFQRNEQYYRAKITTLDFSREDAAPTINAWVSEQTQGKIDGIVDPPISGATVLFLINAIYFKGTWTYTFADSLTVDGTFHLPNGATKQHPFMHQDGTYDYLRTDAFQAVRIPYGKGRVGMYVFLPGKESSLSEFQGTLTAANWSDWMDDFQEMKGHIALPRFRLEFKSKLNDALASLGMGPAICPSNADFNDMFAGAFNPGACISKVMHKTFVEVNEEGTEAAAVTSVEIELTAVPNEPERFYMTIDRPFFFAIRDDQTGTVLFMGSIVEPM